MFYSALQILLAGFAVYIRIFGVVQLIDVTISVGLLRGSVLNGIY